MVRQHCICGGDRPDSPDLYCLIIASRSKLASIRGPGKGSDSVRVTSIRRNASAGCGVPDLYRHIDMSRCHIPDLYSFVKTGRRDTLPIRRPGNSIYSVVMTTIG